MASALITRPRTAVVPKPVRPPLHKVLLHNDDFTPRDFVVRVLEAVFRLGPGVARRVMLTAHGRGCCVVAVFTRDVAETKAAQGTEMGRRLGFPLHFSTEAED